MAHTILNSYFVNLVAKRTTLLEVKSLQYTFRHGHKHYKPEFRKHRSLKNQLLPMYTDKAVLPKHGPNSIHYNFRPHARYWNEPRTVTSHTFTVIDPYDPVKDEEQSWLNPKEAFEKVKTKRKSKKAIRDIQSFDENFEIQDFMDECDEIYKKANESIAAKDEDKMLDYLTPPAYLILAVYDRFGRLMMGSEILAKDVLEIVVFEKRISHAHGMWRVHEKIIIPSGLTARTELPRTKLCEVIEAGTEEQQEVETAVDVSPPTKSSPLEVL